MHRHVVGGVLLAALLCSAPCLAQYTDEHLPDARELLPDDALEAAAFSGPDDASSLAVEGDGRLMRVEARRAMDNHWDVGVSWNTTGPIEADDVLLLTFEARATGPGDSPTGRIHLAFRRVEKPYHHALSKDVQVSAQWRRFEIPFSPAVSMPAGGGTLRLNFGAVPQTIELRNVSLVNYGGEFSILGLCRILNIDPSLAGNRVVGEPLRPTNLWEMGAWDRLPPPAEGFDPEGAWTQTWRIWTCHGYTIKGNRNVGYLRITRTPGDPIELHVEQRIVNYHGLQHITTAEINCAADALARPRSWRIANRFVAPDGTPLDELSLYETGAIEDGLLRVREDGREFTRPAGERVTADWCLFEAIQRLPLDRALSERFDMLEGLSLLKRGHHLSYRGPEEIDAGRRTMTLHHFQQTGHGTLPYDWWVDKDHRLVMVVTHSRAYILDDNVEDEYEDELRANISGYQRDAGRHGGDQQ